MRKCKRCFKPFNRKSKFCSPECASLHVAANPNTRKRYWRNYYFTKIKTNPIKMEKRRRIALEYARKNKEIALGLLENKLDL